MRTILVTRYVTPLREGGSLPAIVEGDDGRLYVLKFRGAGQGTLALIAEVVAGELARALGLRVPELVYAQLDPAIGRSERDPEIQALIQASEGLNLGMEYLSGALAYTPLYQPLAPEVASAIVWFDALVTNVDRTPRNTNLLTWQSQVWLIDHGACLYFHHAGWEGYLARSRTAFPQIKDHVLLPYAVDVPEADVTLSGRLTPDVLYGASATLPDDWLSGDAFPTAAEHRAAYAAYLGRRLEAPRPFVETILHARAQRI